jgi:hypothetical protein
MHARIVYLLFVYLYHSKKKPSSEYQWFFWSMPEKYEYIQILLLKIEKKVNK